MKKPERKDIYELQHGAVVSNTWREEGYNQAYDEMEAYYQQEIKEAIEGMKYKGDISKFKHIATIFDCRKPEEYIWFIRTNTLNDISNELLKENK